MAAECWNVHRVYGKSWKMLVSPTFLLIGCGFFGIYGKSWKVLVFDTVLSHLPLFWIVDLKS